MSNNSRKHARIGILVSVIFIQSARAGVPITFERLLGEMSDLDRLGTLPTPSYVTKQSASNDPQSVSPSDPEAWFANKDWDHWHGEVRRDGRTEYVMMRAQGPGAIVRIWSANPEGTLRIFIDGATTPVIEAPLADLLAGKTPGLGEPIAGVYGKGYNLYLPIPYAKSCEVTTDRKGFYYHVNYRTYAPGTEVASFTRDDLKRFAAPLDVQQQRLASPRQAAVKTDRIESFDALIQPGQTQTLCTLKGERAISQLNVAVPDDLSEAALRTLILKIRFDGETTVEVPLGDFFGAAPGLNAYTSLPLAVSKTGDMNSHWIMPFRESAVVEVKNLGTQAIALQSQVGSVARPWTDESLHFHAGFRAEANRPTMPRFDWNYLTAKGIGRFVGASFTIDNPVRSWWGEGDEKFFVDGETQPSWFGTGTEDYFGYAWGWPGLFEHAYHNQPRCDGPDTYGRTSVNRFHVMDDVPFNSSFKFDMEIWHWADCKVNISATTYWYARPGGSDSFAELTPADLAVHPMPPYKPMKVEGAIEGESMAILKKTATVEPQSWAELSGDQHLWWHGARQGDELVVGFDAPVAGRYHVRGRFMKAADYGIFQLAFNGVPVKEPIDFYSNIVVQTPEVDLGEIDLRAGQNQLAITAIGTSNEGQKQYLFGLDYLLLKPAKAAK